MAQKLIENTVPGAWRLMNNDRVIYDDREKNSSNRALETVDTSTMILTAVVVFSQR